MLAYKSTLIKTKFYYIVHQQSYILFYVLSLPLMHPTHRQFPTTSKHFIRDVATNTYKCKLFQERIQQQLLPMHCLNVSPSVTALGNIIINRIVPLAIAATPTIALVLQLNKMKQRPLGHILKFFFGPTCLAYQQLCQCSYYNVIFFSRHKSPTFLSCNNFLTNPCNTIFQLLRTLSQR